MKSLITFLTFLSVFSAAGAWEMTPIKSNKEVVGYIYHSYGKGTIMNGEVLSKSVASLRLICSTRPETSNAPPLLALLWQDPAKNSHDYKISIKVDNIEIKTGAWSRDGNLFYVPVPQVPNLIGSMSTGKTAIFSWTGTDYKTYSVGYDLKNFSIADFNMLCKTGK